jgi:hypothetical protein
MKKIFSQILEAYSSRELNQLLHCHLQNIQNDGLAIKVEHIAYQVSSVVWASRKIYRYSVCILWSAGLD